jgi:hypothetical protein
MKLLLLVFLIFWSLNIQAQTVDIPFIFYDGFYTVTDFRVGLDSTATYGIDIQLGEFAIPTWLPPTGTLQLWFILDSLDIATYRDYRYAPSFPYSGTQIHIIDGYLSTVATECTMIYDFPQGVTANVKDPFGGTIFNQDLADSGSYSFPIGVYYPYILLTMYYDNVIPVEFTSFTASVLQNEKAIQLNWTTATETNNSGFEILRFTQNDNEWKTIGLVPGFGTTTEPKSYSFIDENITTGTYKYRLKQIDFNGTFEFSNEIEVKVDFTPMEFVLYQNYPNPFNPTTTIKYEIPLGFAASPFNKGGTKGAFVTLKVYDILGNEVATLVNEEKQPGVYEVEFDASLLASGLYLYKLQSGSFVQTMKMILTK